jgi:type IV secretion system protein VirB3
MLSATIFLAAHSPAWLLIAPALHVVFRAICKHDHNAFRVLWMYVDTKGRARNGAAWGGSSATPLSLRRRYTAQEVLRG